MTFKTKKPVIHGRQYDKTGFYWAVIYKPHRSKGHITAIYPRGRDAEMEVNRSNRHWKEQGWAPAWSVKRFKFFFRGTEIDAYEHSWERKEKRLT